jgi:protease I
VKTILMPIGDAAEVLDTFYPMFRLREEGYRVLVAGPEARAYHLVLHEKPPGWDITQESKGYMLTADIAFKDVNPNELAGMVITGGRAPEYLRYDADLLRITKALFAANKPVASVCHGIEILAAADVIRGREVTTVAKCKLDCEFSGGIYLDREVIVNGNLVTCRTWHDNPAWMREYFKLLQGVRG